MGMDWKKAYKDKTVLVTGSCGTVGASLVELLLEMDVNRVVCIDNAEEAIFYQQMKYRKDDRVVARLADIVVPQTFENTFSNVDIVLHAAALKHVPICEQMPASAVMTNIIGIQNVIAAAKKFQVERVLFTSSDKAVNPTNVMGTTKLMGERLITAANIDSTGNTIFASTRFGNVAGSRGSVIPIFHQQIKDGHDITLTSENMTRFMMSNKDACALVLESAQIAKRGEVFVTKMPVIGIKQLAKVMINRLAPVYGHDPEAIAIEVVGARPGEKDYEELTTNEEVRRTFEGNRLLVVQPAFSGVYGNVDMSEYPMQLQPATMEYNSAKIVTISDEEVDRFLTEIGLPVQ